MGISGGLCNGSMMVHNGRYSFMTVEKIDGVIVNRNQWWTMMVNYGWWPLSEQHQFLDRTNYVSWRLITMHQLMFIWISYIMQSCINLSISLMYIYIYTVYLFTYIFYIPILYVYKNKSFRCLTVSCCHCWLLLSLTSQSIWLLLTGQLWNSFNDFIVVKPMVKLHDYAYELSLKLNDEIARIEKYWLVPLCSTSTSSNLRLRASWW